MSKTNLKFHSNGLTLLLIFNQQCTFRESSVRRKRQSLTALRDYISGKKKYHVISEKKKLCNRSYLWLSPIMRLVLKFLLQIKNKLGFRITDEHRKVNGKLFMSMKVAVFEILKTCEFLAAGQKAHLLVLRITLSVR